MMFALIFVLAGLAVCTTVGDGQPEKKTDRFAQDLPMARQDVGIYGSSLPVFETIGEGAQVSAARALVPIKYSYDVLMSLIQVSDDPEQILKAIEICIGNYESGKDPNLFRLRESLERCVVDQIPDGSNPGLMIDEIQNCVESKLSSAAHAADILELVTECIDDIKNQAEQVSIPDCVEQAGAVYEGYLPTIGAAIVRFDTDNVDALRQRLTVFETLECPGLVIKADRAIPLVYLEQHQSDSDNDNDVLTFPNHLAYSVINASPAANHVSTEMTPRGNNHVAIIDDYLDPSYGQGDELVDIDYYDMCQAAGQFGNPSDPSTYEGIYSHGTPLAGIIAGANNGFGNNGVLRGVRSNWGKLSFFGTECSPDAPGIDIGMVLAAMEAIVKGRVEGIRVVCLPFDFQGLPEEYMLEYKRVFKEYFTSVNGRRILWVASVGNDGGQIGPNEVYPAGLSNELDNVISVAGFDPQTLDVSSESNFGSWVDISAPSIVYTATAPGRYGLANGTSMAAALVTASMGLALAGDPGLSAAELSQLVGDLSLRRPIPTANFPSGIDVEKIVKKLVPFKEVARGGKNSGSHLQPAGFQQPGLAGFHFNFVGDGDKKIEAVGIQISPAYGNLEVEYRNDEASEYWWEVDITNLPYGTTLGSFTNEAYKNDDGELVVPVTVTIPGTKVDNHVIGVTGCKCRFTDGNEHNILQFGVKVSQIGSNWSAEALFGDDSDNPWHCTVTYAVVGRHRIHHTEMESGEGAESSDFMASNYLPDLIGSFSMKFTNGDHHLDHLAVYQEPGGVRLRFNDEGNDDPFDWHLTYHVLKRW
jgi:hypothetical protein